MGLGSMAGKLRKTMALGADSASVMRLFALFVRRYDYPMCGILRRLIPIGKNAEGLTTVRLRGAKVVSLSLRPDDCGDVASLFENFVEADSFPPSALPIVVDAGAHVGCFSLRFHSQYPKAEIIAFEPDPDNSRILRQNFQENGISGEVHESALWTNETTLQFSRAASNAGAVVESEMATGNFVEVKAESLESAAGNRLDRIGLLKMDIEGAEMNVLPQVLSLLPRAACLLLELHDAEKNRSRFDSILATARWMGVKTHGYPPHENWILKAVTATS